MNVDPSDYLDQLALPTLALFGEKDVQVSAQVNADVPQASFDRSGNALFVVKIQPNLNHLFQNCKTGSIDEYGRIEETFDTATMDLISDWILQQDS